MIYEVLTRYLCYIRINKNEPNQQVIEWILLQHETDLYISVITIGELQKGIAKLPNSKRKTKLQTWLESDLLTRFENRILEMSIPVASQWGHIQGLAESSGLKMPVLDSLIAVTAITNKAAVVTRNVVDMKQSNVSIVNPWDI